MAPQVGVQMDSRAIREAEKKLLVLLSKAFKGQDAATCIYAFGRIYGTMLATHEIMLTEAVLEPIVNGHTTTVTKMRTMSDAEKERAREFARNWLRKQNAN